MDRSDVITLIAETTAQDEYGVWRTTETERDVFCNVSSVTANEFFDGGRNGLNPQYRMTMFNGDYEDERTLEYNGNRYAIYRTFHAKNDQIELYVERQGGANGSS